jgi:hypothetical protein
VTHSTMWPDLLISTNMQIPETALVGDASAMQGTNEKAQVWNMS